MPKKKKNIPDWFLPLAILVVIISVAGANYILNKGQHKETFLDRMQKANEPTSEPISDLATDKYLIENLSPEQTGYVRGALEYTCGTKI